jgi:hypothetical protein
MDQPMTDFSPPIPYSDHVETIPPDEADDIQRVLDALRQILGRTQAKTGEFRPDVHVKIHGCADGEFRVLPNLPEELAQGLFQRDANFPARVRFSNSASQPQPDAVPDGRGLAIQVRGVSGEFVSPEAPSAGTQDFILINHPVFFVRNVKDYLRLERVLVDADDSLISTLAGGLTAGHWNPLDWHWREALNATQIVGQLPAHPESLTYFSMAPIRYGKYVAKYRVRPAGERHDSYLELVTSLATHSDALRLALEETLRTQEVLFAFQVQLRTCERSMPIEDATVEWPESESPYRTVAHLLLPRQDVTSSHQHPDCAGLSFNVWNALAAHRPLGGINRVRRLAYALSSEWRHQHSGNEHP